MRLLEWMQQSTQQLRTAARMLQHKAEHSPWPPASPCHDIACFIFWEKTQRSYIFLWITQSSVNGLVLSNRQLVGLGVGWGCGRAIEGYCSKREAPGGRRHEESGAAEAAEQTERRVGEDAAKQARYQRTRMLYMASLGHWHMRAEGFGSEGAPGWHGRRCVLLPLRLLAAVVSNGSFCAKVRCMCWLPGRRACGSRTSGPAVGLSFGAAGGASVLLHHHAVPHHLDRAGRTKKEAVHIGHHSVVPTKAAPSWQVLHRMSPHPAQFIMRFPACLPRSLPAHPHTHSPTIPPTSVLPRCGPASPHFCALLLLKSPAWARLRM